MKTQLLIPAAGVGLRLGQAIPKALVDIGGRPLLAHTLNRFRTLGLLDGAVIVVPPGQEAMFAPLLRAAFPGTRFRFAPGGTARQISVANGLVWLDPDTEIVVIHDAARPFVDEDSIQVSIEAARVHGAATVAIPCVDTVLQGRADGFLEESPERQDLWLCQTPQTFQVKVIRQAHEHARKENYVGTDDATLVRRMGGQVKLVRGTPWNFKVTTPADLRLAEYVVREGLA